MSDPLNPFVPPLTPPDVMDLRASCASLRGLGGGVNMNVPFILYLPADDLYCLHAYGSPQAKSANPAVLAACLRAERAEPGFIRRILDPSEPCTVATLSPDARARYASRVAETAALQREAAETAREAAYRRAHVIDPARISLDDI